MFDCVITVKGDGRGVNGRFKEDRTGPVLRFMVDNVHLYSKVKKHIVSCDRCDPTEALRHYLNRRLTLDKFQPKPGATWPIAGCLTGTLANLAMSYEHKCRKTRPIPRELVNEFVWRSADSRMIMKREKLLSVKELVTAAEFYNKSVGGNTFALGRIPETSRFGMVLNVLSHHNVPETEQELDNLIQIAEVIMS